MLLFLAVLDKCVAAPVCADVRFDYMLADVKTCSVVSCVNLHFNDFDTEVVYRKPHLSAKCNSVQQYVVSFPASWALKRIIKGQFVPGGP